MGALVDGVTRAWVMAFGRRGSVFVSVCLSQDGRSRRSRFDIRSWRMLLRKSGMPSRSMLGAKPRLMYNTCELRQLRVFHCSARCVESMCLFPIRWHQGLNANGRQGLNT